MNALSLQEKVGRFNQSFTGRINNRHLNPPNRSKLTVTEKFVKNYLENNGYKVYIAGSNGLPDFYCKIIDSSKNIGCTLGTAFWVEVKMSTSVKLTTNQFLRLSELFLQDKVVYLFHINIESNIMIITKMVSCISMDGV